MSTFRPPTAAGKIRITATDNRCQFTLMDSRSAGNQSSTVQPSDHDKVKYDDGFQAGRAASEAENKAEFDRLNAIVAAQQTEINDANQNLTTLRASISQALSHYLGDLEIQVRNEIVDVSFMIAEIIIRREIDQKCTINEVIQESLSLLVSFDNLKLFLNPEDLEVVNGDGETAIPANVTLIPDSTLARGESRLDSENGRIDATISSRMQSIRERLEKRLAS